ncbi:MAG: ATP synthase F1 subunit epsilon [Alphaproteobacteria bacterium]
MATEDQNGSDAVGLFHFELATPELLAASGEYGLVIVPGAEGDFGVLAGHASLISSLRPGVVRAWREAKGGLPPEVAPETWFISGGFAEVGATRLTLLVQEAEPVDSLDAAEIKQSLQNAREDLEDTKGDDEETQTKREEIQKRIDLLEARLEVASQ